MPNSGKGQSFSNGLMALIFNGTSLTLNSIGIAINATASPATTFYVALHTATPDFGGSQTTNEISYTNYARQPVARTTGGWTVSNFSTGAQVVPVAAITFPASAGGTGGTAGYWSVGTNVSGSGVVLYYGQVNPAIVISAGVTPQLTTASNISEI